MSWPRRPLRLAVAAFVAWAALTVIGEFLIGEFLDQGSTWERIAHDGLGAIQTLLLAVVVGGGLLEWWQRREWQRRTQWIAFSLLNQAMRQLANLASKVVDVASPPDHHGSVAPLSAVFTLPWSAVSDRAIKAQVRVFGSPLLLLFEEGVAAHDEKIGAYRSRVIERLQAIRSDLEEHVDRLGGLALEIVNHVDDVRGPQLRTSVADLHDAVRELVDPFPGDRVPDPLWAMFTVGQPGVVLTSSGKVAQRLSEAYVSLQDRVTDESLRKRLQAEARLRSENDQSTSDLINQDEEMERRMATMEQHLRKLDEIAPTIERMMEKALASPDTDESTRREISEARKQLDKKLIELEKMLSDAAE